jgi:DNA ligase-1
VALRFARVLRYRDDKKPDQVDTLAAVRALLPG